MIAPKSSAFQWITKNSCTILQKAKRSKRGKEMTAVRRLGIIGVGPRGGYALERLMIELASAQKLNSIHISLFERTGSFGNGRIYDLNQALSNWINIHERDLKLDKREEVTTDALYIASFPSYHEWAGKDFDKISEEQRDTFPPRSQVGDYLAQRFQSLVQPLMKAGLVDLYEEEVKDIERLDNDQFQIVTDADRHEPFHEILLTIGHQDTEPSEQIAKWQELASDYENIYLFKSPYPVTTYSDHEAVDESSVVGIRGFGLAMIDAVRAVASKFGTFHIVDEKSRQCEYQSDQDLKDLLVPFSLTGLPPVPKPLNARIDSWFKPTDEAIEAFKKQISDSSVQKKADSTRFLIDAFAPMAAAIYRALPSNNDEQDLSTSELASLIRKWLENQTFKHPTIVPTAQSPKKSMEDFIGMAIGKQAISLDFCIGHVWRKCQPTIYEALSYNECSNKVFAEVIKLDESTKRYSYGPPVESLQQLITLAEVGVLNLNFADDPKIEVTAKGWQFTKDNQSITAGIMIDSVLDAPRVKSVQTVLVNDLLDDHFVKVVHDDFGVKTNENGYIISRDNQKKTSIALLGRLAKGTIIGVDAILECFGARPRRWAEQAAEQHIQWLEKEYKQQPASAMMS
ncbi:MAG: FAD/NAD(P)-binding protein [Bacteroidota bacterium]